MVQIYLGNGNIADQHLSEACMSDYIIVVVFIIQKENVVIFRSFLTLPFCVIVYERGQKCVIGGFFF